MADQILIKDLLLRAIIGIKPEERINRQDVLINIVLDVDTQSAAKSDQIEDAVNYRDITKNVIKIVEASEFFLLEKLTEEVAAVCLQDANVQKAKICVEKPGALRFARSVGIQIEREQQK